MDIYQDFYKAYYDRMKEYFLNYYDDDIEINIDNFEDIIFQPADYQAEFSELKSYINISLPKHFLKFYSYYRTLEPVQIPFASVKIATATIDTAGRLINYLEDNKNKAVINLGLIPFGLYEDEWLICLDMNNKQTQDNPPIRLFELTAWDEPEKAVSPKVWFSSFDNFILCLTDLLKTGSTVNFSFLDTENNFKTAYSHWDKKTD